MEQIGKIIRIQEAEQCGTIALPTGAHYSFQFNELKGVSPQHQSPVIFIAEHEQATNIREVFFSRDQQLVADRPDHSHLHRNVRQLLPKALMQISLMDRFTVEKTVHFPENIGLQECVPTIAEDDVFYAVREHRKGHSRFVRNKTPLPTNALTVILKKHAQHYRILTCFFGPKATVEPFDKRANRQAYDFWKNHALVEGADPYDPDTVTSECPWKIPSK